MVKPASGCDIITTEQFRKGLDDKLIGQIMGAFIGQHHLGDAGLITLTS
jgi:hypothetical protein